MSMPKPTFRHWIIWAVALVAGSAVIAHAQLGGGGPASKEKDRQRLEYLNQEVQADVVVGSLNELDGQGWEVFQIVPVWKIDSVNGATGLSAKSYQVFGRRPLAGK